MVTDTQKNVSEFFGTFSEVTRKAFDAGRNAQSAWFDAAKNFNSSTDFLGGVSEQSSKAFKNWFPLMEKNFQTATETTDRCFRGGMSALQTACGNLSADKDADLQVRTQEACEKLIEAARSNTEAMTSAGTKVLDNWRTFCQSTGEQAPAQKPSPKSGK